MCSYLLQVLPHDHKFVKAFMSGPQDLDDYLLFKKDLVIEENKGYDVDAYKNYYKDTTRIKMLCSFTDIFVNLSKSGPDSPLERLFREINEILVNSPKLNHQVAGIFRALLISVFKLEKFDNLVPILVNSGSIWKFIKMIFAENVQERSGKAMSEEATRIFDIVLNNKQYFINPIESLVYNVR